MLFAITYVKTDEEYFQTSLACFYRYNPIDLASLDAEV